MTRLDDSLESVFVLVAALYFLFTSGVIVYSPENKPEPIDSDSLLYKNNSCTWNINSENGVLFVSLDEDDNEQYLIELNKYRSFQLTPTRITFDDDTIMMYTCSPSERKKMMDDIVAYKNPPKKEQHDKRCEVVSSPSSSHGVNMGLVLGYLLPCLVATVMYLFDVFFKT